MKEALEFTLGTNNAAFKSGLNAAKSSVSAFKGEVTGMLTGMFAGIGIESLIADFARIQDIAEMFGSTAEAVQRVKGAAEQAGTSIEAIAKEMAKLRADGGDGLAKLGIDAEKFANAGMDGQLLMVSQALDGITDPQQRVNIALEVFGAKGKELLPLLTQGYDTLKASMDSTAVASNATVAALDAADGKIRALTNQVKVFGAEAIGGLVTWVERLSAAGLLAYTYISKLPGGFAAAAEAGAEIIDAQKMLEWQKTVAAEKAAKGTGTWHPTEAATGPTTAEKIADLEAAALRKQLPIYEQLAELALARYAIEQEIAKTSDPDAKKALEEKLVANVKERLSLEEQDRKDADESVARVAKEQEDAAKAEHAQKKEFYKDEREAANRRAKQEAELLDKATKDAFDAREKDMGFASGVSGFSGTGQRMAGVDYGVINSEAEKGIALQEEMRNYLATIANKEWTISVPEAE
ncbi:MAG: hypothetical protein WCS65_17395 [Verrucomicrobiae bacterium]